MNNKEINRLRELQRKAKELEEKALIKEKERELKKRIKVAKNTINGPSIFDVILGNNKTSTQGSKSVSFEEIFNEPRPISPVPKQVSIPMKSIPMKNKPGRPKTKKAPKTEVVEDFIVPEPMNFSDLDNDLDLDLEMDRLQRNIKKDDMRGLF